MGVVAALACGALVVIILRSPPGPEPWKPAARVRSARGPAVAGAATTSAPSRPGAGTARAPRALVSPNFVLVSHPSLDRELARLAVAWFEEELARLPPRVREMRERRLAVVLGPQGTLPAGVYRSTHGKLEVVVASPEELELAGTLIAACILGASVPPDAKLPWGLLLGAGRHLAGQHPLAELGQEPVASLVARVVQQSPGLGVPDVVGLAGQEAPVLIERDRWRVACTALAGRGLERGGMERVWAMLTRPEVLRSEAETLVQEARQARAGRTDPLLGTWLASQQGPLGELDPDRAFWWAGWVFATGGPGTRRSAFEQYDRYLVGTLGEVRYGKAVREVARSIRQPDEPAPERACALLGARARGDLATWVQGLWLARRDVRKAGVLLPPELQHRQPASLATRASQPVGSLGDLVQEIEETYEPTRPRTSCKVLWSMTDKPWHRRMMNLPDEWRCSHGPWLPDGRHVARVRLRLRTLPVHEVAAPELVGPPIPRALSPWFALEGPR